MCTDLNGPTGYADEHVNLWIEQSSCGVAFILTVCVFVSQAARRLYVTNLRSCARSAKTQRHIETPPGLLGLPPVNSHPSTSASHDQLGGLIRQSVPTVFHVTGGSDPGPVHRHWRSPSFTYVCGPLAARAMSSGGAWEPLGPMGGRRRRSTRMAHGA